MNIQAPTRPTQIAALDTLYHHPTNPRQTHDADDIRLLAQSISAVGLLQNLSGYIDPILSGIGIVAGGRRLAALQLIANNPDDFPDGVQIDFAAIPVITTTDPALSRSWAGAEAATQRPLHPADEIRAYGAMVTDDHDPTAIARAFGCTVQHVKRRLKLANLPHDTLMALREDKITLDAAAALTLCTTPEQHTEMLADAIRFPNQHSSNLRREILQGRISGADRRALFVGPDLYTMEGGTVEEDLFAEKMIFTDEVLLDKLFLEKLTTAAEQAQTEQGYAKAIPVYETHVSWSHTEHMTRPARVPFDLPEGDAVELATLEEKSRDQELTESGHERMSILEDRKMGSFRDEDIAAGTAFVFVDRNGTLISEGPYLPRAGATDLTDASGAEKIIAKPPITQGGMDDLHRISLLALQTKLLDKPDLILDLLAFQLSHDVYSHSGPLNITANPQPAEPSCTDEVRTDKRLSEFTEAPLTTDAAEAFTAFKMLGKAHRNKVLAHALSRALNQPRSSTINAALVETLDASPRTVWTPTAANHFKACSVPTLDAVWRELVCDAVDYQTDEMERFAKLKKGEKTKELEALFSDTSVQEALGLSRAQVAAIDAWLPVVLRREAE